MKLKIPGTRARARSTSVIYYKHRCVHELATVGAIMNIPVSAVVELHIAIPL